jgi:nitroreductase
MDTYLAVVSKREVRSYADRPLPDRLVREILEAGRVTGSSQNRQPWRFVVVDDPARVADTVYVPENLRGARLCVALAMDAGRPSGFDAGRVAQNMMLAAWNKGVGSCPNGVADAERLHEQLGLDAGEQVSIVLTFGYPARGVDPESRSAAEWIQRADRRSFDDVVRRA